MSGVAYDKRVSNRAGWMVVVLGVAACGNDAPRGAPGSGSGSGSSALGSADQVAPVERSIPMTPIELIDSLPEPAIALPVQTGFELRAPGTGKREVLRYAFAAGRAEVATERTTRTATDNEPWSEAATWPMIRDGFEVTTAAPQPSGWRLSMHATDPVLAPGATPAAQSAAAAQVERWRAQVGTRRFDLDLDARASVVGVRFLDDVGAVPAADKRSAVDDVVQRLLASVVPVPSEAVGVGATWHVRTNLRQGTAVVTQDADYTLTARTADAWTIDVKVRRVGEPQRVVDPALPPGSVAELIALVRESSGTLTVDPRKLLPVAGELSLTMMVHGTVSDRTQTTQYLSEDNGRTVFAAPPSPTPSVP